MFTGIITDSGEVIAFHNGLLELATTYDMTQIPIGASIACDGVCLTVVNKAVQHFSAEVSQETLARTTLGQWQPGRKVNLERPVQAGGEFGGHFVTGHVDGVGVVSAFYPQQEFRLLEVEFTPALRDYIVEKGSITINGVSLTVNKVAGNRLHVTLIPHTAKVTNLGSLTTGMEVNLEVDLIARYIAPYLQRLKA